MAKRYAIVGLGSRAELWAGALADPARKEHELVALCDVNRARMGTHNAWLADKFGVGPLPTYDAGDFARMLGEQSVDVVMVCTVDRTHDQYIVGALEAGVDVLTEKPMTIDAERCQRILDTRAETGRSVTVAFNYRFNPVHEKVREVLASGAIGEIGSVHFEWLLDVRHGADYFRRWHRDKANSGGLLVHKATHHFDLVNWWIDSGPETVFAFGKLFFYGDENGRRHGFGRGYERAHGAPEAAGDPFALDLAGSQKLRALYLDAEAEDGYHRDQNVFGAGITIEDDMAVLVRYASGATMTYHLAAYEPWEGYRIAFNGGAGRLELIVRENAFAAPPGARAGDATLQDWDRAGSGATLTLHPFWQPPREVELPRDTGAHGGGDARMITQLFDADGPDPLGRRADHLDGARSILTGLAANRSIETGRPVRVDELVRLDA